MLMTSSLVLHKIVCVKNLKGEFEMSMMGELSFFLRLQVKQTKDGIFLC